ncbi:TPA: hypothetical protein POB08_004870 [Escherichia coli]|nr:hypothetical protein [Escherichia coli]HDI6367924.1 hypothetical protein [Escherichia coli]
MVPNGWALQDFNSLKIATIDGDRGKNYPKKEDYLQIGHALFLGSSRISGECLSDFQKEVFGIPVAIAHSLQQFDFVVHPL